MKKKKMPDKMPRFSWRSNIRLMSLALPVILNFYACSGMLRNGGEQVEMSKAASVPAAEAAVRAREDKNGNTALEIEAKHLASPSALKDRADTYVVWAEDKESGRMTNLGALKINAEREGRMEAITPLRTFEIFVTPEETADMPAPKGARILWASLNLD